MNTLKEYEPSKTCPKCNGPEITSMMHERGYDGWRIPTIECQACGHVTFVGKVAADRQGWITGHLISREDRRQLERMGLI